MRIGQFCELNASVHFLHVPLPPITTVRHFNKKGINLSESTIGFCCISQHESIVFINWEDDKRSTMKSCIPEQIDSNGGMLWIIGRCLYVLCGHFADILVTMDWYIFKATTYCQRLLLCWSIDTTVGWLYSRRVSCNEQVRPNISVTVLLVSCGLSVRINEVSHVCQECYFGLTNSLLQGAINESMIVDFENGAWAVKWQNTCFQAPTSPDYIAWSALVQTPVRVPWASEGFSPGRK